MTAPAISYWRLLFVAGMLLLPFSTGPETGPGVVALGLIPLAGCVVVLLLMIAAYPSLPLASPGVLLPAGALAVALLAATLYSAVPLESAARLVPNLIGFCLFLVIASPLLWPAGRREEKLDFIIAVFIASATVLSLYFLANFAYNVMVHGIGVVLLDRVTGGTMSLPWGASNVIASALIFPFFLTFHTAEPSRRRGRAGVLVARLVILAAMVATQSRGALAAAALGLVLVTLLSGRKEGIRLLVLGAIIVAVAAYVDSTVGGFLRREVIGTFVERFRSEDMLDLNGRLNLWRIFTSELSQEPLLGIGYYATPAYLSASGHNVVLTTLVERGAIGFLLSSLIIVSAAATAISGYVLSSGHGRKFFVYVIAGGVASLAHLMVEDANFTQQYMIYSWIALALVYLGWETLPQARGPARRSRAGAPWLRPA